MPFVEDNAMRKIAITVPEFFNGEAAAITALLRDGGYWRVHIRKPRASAAQIEALVSAIPAGLYPRLSLHDHFDIAVKLHLGGIHLNRRNPVAPACWDGLVSRSFHSPGEISAATYDYAFLSPIYPSISKPGYSADFSRDEIRHAVNDRIFALGGITPDKFDEVEALGFGGVAMLGCVWRAHIDPAAFRLQYITHPVDGTSMAEQVEKALAGGCRWIQLRHKDADTATLLREGKEIRRLCDRYDAIFIVDDHVELVDAVQADGVHLGKNDMPVSRAREMLGVRTIIGATANTFDDIAAAHQAGADYIGLGPYRFTTTKEKLSPVLGIDGYNDIVARCTAAAVRLPIVAIGGITLPDIAPIMAAGVNGVAVSGTIRNASDPTQITQEIIKRIQ